MTLDQISEFPLNFPARIHDILKPWLENTPDRPALVEAAGTWTYRQLAAVIAETQTWLLESGIRPGDRVMIVCENCRALAALLFATTALDAWPVLVNAHLSAREVDQIRDHCAARRVVYTVGVSHHANDHATRHAAAISEVGGLGQVALGPIDETAEAEPIEAQPANRVAALIYTSGTTGLPKGVMLTHRNLLFIAAVSARIRRLTPDDRLYGILPMSHAVGLSVVLLGNLLSGATLYLSPHFDPMTARKTIETERLTVVLGVPSMFAQFLQYAKLRGITSLNFPALRIISSSGAPLDLATKKATERFFGIPLHNGYGITECSPTIAQGRIDTPRDDTSVGPLLPGVEAKFVGPNGDEVRSGGVGELWVRGPNIMKGYYRAPEETAAAINPGGWFNTRDLARLEDGNLFVVGRTKDLIVRAGFNVYPVEVEAVLNAHSAVARSAVMGRVVAGDEQVLAFVQLVPESQVTARELSEHAARSLATYKRPSKILIIPSMPLTPTGKIVKQELAMMLETEASVATV